MAENQETTPLLNEGTSTGTSTKPASKKTRIILGIFAIIGILAITGWTVYRITEKTPLVNEPLKIRLYTHNIRFDNHHTDVNEEVEQKKTIGYVID